MKKVIRQATKVGYGKIAKPILFRQKPDQVHSQLVLLTKIIQRMPVIKEVPRAWRYHHDLLHHDVLGITFQNPVGLSAGFDKNAEMVTTMKAVGFGFMTAGSVTAEVCDGNPRPWFHRLPKTQSLVVYAGLPNHGIERIARRIRAYRKGTFIHFPLFLSVAKTNSREAASDEGAIKDYCYSLQLAASQQLAQVFEINISCPNTYGGEPFTTPERLERLLRAIDALHLKQPVVIKMPIDKTWDEYKKLIDVILRHDIEGVTVGNLLKDRAVADLRDPLSDTVRGNLSGKPTAAISTELIRETYAYAGERLTIIGVGGIFTAEDAYEKIKAGASLVQLITGMIFQGPQVAGEINQGLVALLERDGYQSVRDAVGADHR